MGTFEALLNGFMLLSTVDLPLGPCHDYLLLAFLNYFTLV